MNDYPRKKQHGMFKTDELVATALGRLSAQPPRWLLVDTDRQRLLLVQTDTVVRTYAVSTAAFIDAREGSQGTPPGVHSIAGKIGAGLQSGAILESREPTGAVWHPADPPVSDDLILSRVLTLSGQEEGVNRGPGYDSLARYIYIHGTNHEERIGNPESHGCIRLTNHDIIDLFERVEEGDPVVIV